MKKLPSVLLIDDDSTNNFLNERLLARLEVAEQVLVAESGRQALTLLSQVPTPPTLILLDVNMPGLSGMEFLTAYQPQRHEQVRPPVVLMLTTSMDAKDLARIDELQIDGLVSKPLTEAKLLDLLRLHFPAYVAA